MFNRVGVVRISWDKVMVKLNHRLNYSVGVTKSGHTNTPSAFAELSLG